MPTINATINKRITNDESAIVISWAGLAAATDVGDPQMFAAYSDKTFIVTGSFAGSTVVLEGSNDGVNWVTLTNRQGTAMTFTAPGMNTSQDRPAFVRPNQTVGSGANITVTACCHRTDFPGPGR